MICKDLLNRISDLFLIITEILIVVLMNIINLIIHQKINESFYKLNNGEWEKIINKFLNLKTCNHTTIHPYLAAQEIGFISRWEYID